MRTKTRRKSFLSRRAMFSLQVTDLLSCPSQEEPQTSAASQGNIAVPLRTSVANVHLLFPPFSFIFQGRTLLLGYHSPI